MVFVSQLISTSSPWYDKLRAEIKYFEDINIDIDKLMVQNRESDKIRGQMAVLERRVQVSIDLHVMHKIHNNNNNNNNSIYIYKKKWLKIAS